MRRLAVALVLLLAVTVWPAAGGLADRSTTIQATDGLRADFNNDGFADLAVGAPGEDFGAADRGGVVNALRGSAGG